MIEAILQEKKTIRQWIVEYDIAGIISDNRLGVYSKKYLLFLLHTSLMY